MPANYSRPTPSSILIVDDTHVLRNSVNSTVTASPISGVSWSPNTVYAQYQMVSYQGHWYSAKVAFTSGTTFDVNNWNTA